MGGFRRGNKDDEGDDRPKDRRPGSKPPPDKEEDKSGRRFGPPSFGRGGDDKGKPDDKPVDSGTRRFSSPGGGDKPAEPPGGARRPFSSGGGSPPSSSASDESSGRRFGGIGGGRDDKDKDAGSRPGGGGFRRPGAGDEKKDEDQGGARRFSNPLGRGRSGEDEKKDDKPGDRSPSSSGRPPLSGSGGGGDRPAGGGSPFNRDRDADSGGRPGASPSSPRSTGTFGTNRDADSGGSPSGNRPFAGGGGGSSFNRDRDADSGSGGRPGGDRPGGGGSPFNRDRDADSGGSGSGGRPGGSGGSSFNRDRDADSGGGSSGSRLSSGGGGGGSPFSRDRDADSGGSGSGGRPGGDRPGGSGGSSFNRDRDADSGSGSSGSRLSSGGGGGGSPFSRDRDADSGGSGGRPAGDRPGGGGSPFSRDRDADSGSGGRPGSPTGSGSPDRNSPSSGGSFGGRPAGGSPSSPSSPSSPNRPPIGGSGEASGGRPGSPSNIASPARPGSSPQQPARPGISPSPARPGTKPPEPEAPKRALPGFGGRKEAPTDTPKRGDAKPKEDEGGRRFGVPSIGRKSSPEEDKKKVDDRRRKEEPPKRGTVEVKKDPKAAAKTSRATTTAARLPERADTGIRNVTRGLDYNRKLDIAGYLLLGGFLILISGLLESIFSSSPKGFTYDLDQFLAQFFGLGRIVIPAVCFVIGLWLVIRHFGKVIEIDYFRIAGLGVLFVTLLTTLQWWELMWTKFPTVNEVPTIEALEAQSRALWQDGGGGGVIGHVIYMALERFFWDIGVPVVLVIAWGLGTLFAFDLSFGKMATNIRTTRANRQAKREAALARYAESKGLVPAVATSAPSAAPAPPAPAMAVAATVLAAEESTGPQRNVGKGTGRTAAPVVPATSAVPVAPVAAAPAAPVAVAETKRGVFGRRKEDAPTDAPITAATDGDAPKRAEKEGGLFGRKKEDASTTDKPITADTDGDTPKRAPSNIPGMAPTTRRDSIETRTVDQPKPATSQSENAEDTGPRRRLPSFGGRSETSESTDKPATATAIPTSAESAGGRRIPGLPGRNTSPAVASGEATGATPSTSAPSTTPTSDESAGGRRLPGLRPSFGRSSAPSDGPESAGKPVEANEAAPAEDQASRRRFGVPSLPSRKGPEKPAEPESATNTPSTTDAAAAVVAGMTAAEAAKPSRFGNFGRRGETPTDTKSTDTPAEAASPKPEKSEPPVSEKPATPVAAPRPGVPDLTRAERAMLNSESSPAEQPSKPAEPVVEAAPVVAESALPEAPQPASTEATPSEPAATPANPETLTPVRRGFPQFTAAEAAMMGVAAATSTSDEPNSESTPPLSGAHRPMSTPPRDLPGRQPAESGGLFSRGADRPSSPPPPSVRLAQPENASNEDTQVVETNATQPITAVSDNSPDALPRRPFAKPTGDAPLFRRRETGEAPIPSAVPVESEKPAADLSANPSGVALASDLTQPKSDDPETSSALPDQPAQPRGLPVRPPNEPIARERPATEGGDEAARLSHFQRAFGGETPEGEKPQRANFVPRREPLGRATGERPAISTQSAATSEPVASAETAPPVPVDEDAGAIPSAQPRFLRQNPFDQPEGETENIVPPVHAVRPIGRPVSRPPQIGGANPDLDKTEFTEGEGEEAATGATPARASLVPFTARRDHPPVAQPISAVDDEDDDDDDEVPAVTAPPAAARHPEPEAEPEKSNGAGGEMSSKWVRPDFMTILEEGSEQKIDQEILLERAHIIEDTLESFGAPGKVIEVNTGPVITQFGVEPDYVEKRGGQRSRVKVSAIAALDRDLALALAAKSIRIEAPVPGKGFVGIEVPNAETAVVSLRDVMASELHQRKVAKSKLLIGLGRRVDGAPISADLTEMPHLLIAGATGSGKSVCVNAIISCLLLQNTPDELQMIMVDPKRVELAGYNGIPHLVAPVVVDLERIVGVLKWVQREMDDRYKRFATLGARNILDFNRKRPQEQPQMPYLVVIVDELADLMMLAPDETERLVARLAQMARATGIHLIISTQRPSVDVVTGLIKANFPARIAFAVASSVDSRVIIDQPGAEKLLGRGDMLFQAPDAAAPLRMQGVYLSDNEINRINSFWKSTRALKGGKGSVPERPPMSSSPLDEPAKPVGVGRRPDGGPVINDRRSTGQPVPPSGGNGENRQDRQQTFWEEVEEAEMGSDDDAMEGVDDLYDEAVKLVRGRNKASISMLQRHFRIGYTRSARLIDLMEERGVVGPAESGAKPRLVIPEKEGGE